VNQTEQQTFATTYRMNTAVLLTVLLGCVALASARMGPPRFPKQRMGLGAHPDGPKYKTYYYNTRIDKFGYTRQDEFSMRYLVNDDWWAGNNGPIFFYAGNEGDVTGFANNTGVMYELGAEESALIVFAEHRYYGESRIDGNSNFDYLSAEYALADYAEFVTWLKAEGQWEGTADSPVIVFGGSYGGMLAAWMRQKYPFVVYGAWAASAPVAWFQNLTDCNAYDLKCTADFADTSSACPVNIRKSWDVIDEYGETPAGLAQLTQIFNLCSPLENSNDLSSELQDAWGSVAMVNYPYPTTFLEDLPAWPVSVICSNLNQTGLTDDQLLVQVAAAANVFYNYAGTQTCFNISQGEIGLDDDIWLFQACTEMVMPFCSDSKTSMFPPGAWNENQWAAFCRTKFRSVGSSTRPAWADTQFGARDVLASSNIIFSNGELDPWAAGGVSDNLDNPSLHIFYIKDAAHHLDLRASHPADPEPVTEARSAEMDIVRGWIKQYTKERLGLY
jgi:lysosomal Pro-X carboxypeptidase